LRFAAGGARVTGKSTERFCEGEAGIEEAIDPPRWNFGSCGHAVNDMSG